VEHERVVQTRWVHANEVDPKTLAHRHSHQDDETWFAHQRETQWIKQGKFLGQRRYELGKVRDGFGWYDAMKTHSLLERCVQGDVVEQWVQSLVQVARLDAGLEHHAMIEKQVGHGYALFKSKVKKHRPFMGE
jgi:hypothetical protein